MISFVRRVAVFVFISQVFPLFRDASHAATARRVVGRKPSRRAPKKRTFRRTNSARAAGAVPTKTGEEHTHGKRERARARTRNVANDDENVTATTTDDYYDSHTIRYGRGTGRTLRGGCTVVWRRARRFRPRIIETAPPFNC